MPLYELTETQARRLAMAAAYRIAAMDACRPRDWELAPTEDPLTRSDQQYRAEIEDAYNAIMQRGRT